MNLRTGMMQWDSGFRNWPMQAAAIAGMALALAFGSGSARAEELKTESRMPYLHHIPLRDAEGQIITLPAAFDEQGKPQEARGNPYSTAETCGRCHEYAAISHGWHFNAAKG